MADLKTKNAKMKLESAAVQLMQAPKRAEVQAFIALAGGNPALWDYPTGFALSTGQTGSAASTNKLDWKKIGFRWPIVVRITTTVGSTPTCTYAIEGSKDGSTSWTALYYADSATPTTFVNTTFVITTATTVIKLVQANQDYRFLRINYTSNTNVTNTADAILLGDA